MTWDQKKKTIYTDEAVRVIQEGKTLFGDGLIADESFTDYEIINPRGEFDLESGGDEKPVKKTKTVTKKKSNTGTKKISKKKQEKIEEEEFSDFDSY